MTGMEHAIEQVARARAEGDRSAEPRLNTMRSTDDGETWQWTHTTPAAEGAGRAEQ